MGKKCYRIRALYSPSFWYIERHTYLRKENLEKEIGTETQIEVGFDAKQIGCSF